MEIKCKVSFTLPEDLIESLGIDEDTPHHRIGIRQPHSA